MIFQSFLNTHLPTRLQRRFLLHILQESICIYFHKGKSGEDLKRLIWAMSGNNWLLITHSDSEVLLVNAFSEGNSSGCMYNITWYNRIHVHTQILIPISCIPGQSNSIGIIQMSSIHFKIWQHTLPNGWWWWCRHGNGNANTAASAVFSTAASPTTATAWNTIRCRRVSKYFARMLVWTVR